MTQMQFFYKKNLYNNRKTITFLAYAQTLKTISAVDEWTIPHSPTP